MNMNRIAGALMASALFVGCAADTGDLGEESNEEMRPPAALTDEAGSDVTARHLGAPGTTRPLPERGGSGGSAVPGLRGAVIYGIQMYTGRLVDKLQLAYYVPSGADNQYRSGDFYASLGPVGGGGGTWHDWQYCPSGFGAIGIQGRAGDKLDALGLLCANLANPAQQVSLQVYGGGGGNGFFDTCNNTELLTGVNLRAGTKIDRIQGYCQKVR